MHTLKHFFPDWNTCLGLPDPHSLIRSSLAFYKTINPNRNKIHVHASASRVKLNHGPNMPLFPKASERVEIRVIHGGKSQCRAAELYIVCRMWNLGLKILAIWEAEQMWWQVFAQKADWILVWKGSLLLQAFCFSSGSRLSVCVFLMRNLHSGYSYSCCRAIQLCY